MSYTVLISQKSFDRCETYLSQLRLGTRPGGRLAHQMAKVDLNHLNTTAFLEHLIQTKPTRIFAESQVCGDGSDWNHEELAILGDVGVAAGVRVFDNGRHQNPELHSIPIQATLLFTPGALLRSGSHQRAADWEEVTRNGKIDQDAYTGLYERRLLPHLKYANEQGLKHNRKVMVTCPGLGCGQFAGPFHGSLGAHLESSLCHILSKYAKDLLQVSLIYYDPYRECSNANYEFEHISLLVRPLTHGNEAFPQLCSPAHFTSTDDTELMLFSFVAWDHVSWPGNDFYAGDRVTDDGVKAAATDVLFQITGIEGSYNDETNGYEPPGDYKTWTEVVVKNKLKLMLRDRLEIYG